jgi:hypothetical protein
MVNEIEHLGAIVKNLMPLHDLEYKVVFNLHENTFFQKLVSKDVLERVRVKSADYFKALIFLDYFTRVINNNYSVCDNLENLSKALRDQERAKNEDKGEKGISYLTLETVVFETGLFAKEKRLELGKVDITKKEENEIKKRYLQEEKVDLNSPDSRKLDPFYEAIGEMVSSQLSNKIKPYLIGVESRADIGAMVFTDSVLEILHDSASKQEIYNKLSLKDYSSASLSALKGLMKESSLSKIKLSIEKNAN